MSMKEWAEREIELAKEASGFDEYANACCDSALKAFNSLLEDEHSELCISITKALLNRLIDGKCLTPIQDTEDIWNDVTYDENENCKKYQCKRMSSLFKDVYEDGSVKYIDVNRIHSHDINSMTWWHSSLTNAIVDELYPIEMPYAPSSKGIEVTIDKFLVDNKNGDFDTVGVLTATLENGETVSINRYFTIPEDENDPRCVYGIWIEITEEEFYNLKKVAIERGYL